MSGATDTLRTVNTLREAGVPDRQAAAHARATDDAVSEAIEALATRADVFASRAELQAEIAALRGDMYRAMLIQTGVIVGAVVALMRLIP